MKATELRIGNYIFISILQENGGFADELFRVNSTVIRDAEHYGNEWNASPIPLTEEWLLKFGFTNKKETGMSVADSWQGLDYWFIDGNIDNFILRGDPKYGLSIQSGIRAYPQRNIKYVHQLQNLYFALTGEELTLTK